LKGSKSNEPHVDVVLSLFSCVGGNRACFSFLARWVVVENRLHTYLLYIVRTVLLHILVSTQTHSRCQIFRPRASFSLFLFSFRHALAAVFEFPPYRTSLMPAQTSRFSPTNLDHDTIEWRHHGRRRSMMSASRRQWLPWWRLQPPQPSPSPVAVKPVAAAVECDRRAATAPPAPPRAPSPARTKSISAHRPGVVKP